MKVMFSVAAFAEAAKAVRSIPDAGVKIDILDHALLHAADGQLSLTMSDADLEGRATIEAEPEGEILAAIPRAVLDFFIKRAAEDSEKGSLEFDAAMRNVVARHGPARMAIAILRGEDFPAFPPVDPAWSFKIRGHELCGLLKLCQKAIAVADDRYYLKGVFLHVTKEALGAVATDGHRLHLGTIDKPELTGDMPKKSGLPGVIVPDMAVPEIIRVFDGDEAEITVSGTDSRIIFESERLRLISKLIDGTYPDYQRIMPAPGDFRITVPAKALDAALDGLMVIPKSEGKGKASRTREVRITPEGETILLEMKGDQGDIQDRIPAKVAGEGNPIVLNARLLRDALSATDHPQATLAPGADTNWMAVRLLDRGDAADFVIMQTRY